MSTRSEILGASTEGTQLVGAAVRAPHVSAPSPNPRKLSVRLRLSALLGLSLGACGDPPLDSAGALARRASFDVTCDPDAGLDTVSRVSRFRLTPSGSSLASTRGAAIYRGALTDYYLARIRAGEQPGTLAERRVPCRTWSDGAALIVAPTLPLEAGETYTLVVRSGARALLTVRGDDARPLLARVWPPAGALGAGPVAVYCGEAVSLGASVRTELLPDGIAAVVEPGAAPSVALGRCVRVRAVEPVPVGGWLMPPAVVEGHLMDPAPLDVVHEGQPGRRTCTGVLVPVGPGCADVDDDRFTLHSPNVATFWAIGGAGVDWFEALAPSARAVIRGLVPGESALLRISAITEGGHVWEDSVTLEADAPMPHVIINEVLSDPIGPEPAQEWVELYNDGSEEADMDGWSFEDAGGSAALDGISLAPGAFLLLVRDNFDAKSPADVPPEGRVLVVRLAALGKNGLGNDGEPLTLRDEAGRVVSRFPASPKPKTGISIARREPWRVDEDPEAFAYHAAPGASPGSPNQVE